MVPLSLLQCSHSHDRLFLGANRCPGNGGRPSGPTVCFSLAAQGPVTETLRTALHRPAALCTQKKIVLSPSTHLRLFQSEFIVTNARGPCQEVWLTGRMKQIHKTGGRVCEFLFSISTFAKMYLQMTLYMLNEMKM